MENTSRVVEAFVEANTPKKPKAEKRATKVRPAQRVEGHTLPTGKLLPQGVNLATIPEIAFGLAELCGRHVSRIGQAFKCILPGHQEGRPSAAFCYGDNGTIVYHCFHHEKHGTPEFLTLAEVYHAVATGQIRKLSRVEASKLLFVNRIDPLCANKIDPLGNKNVKGKSLTPHQPGTKRNNMRR